MFLLSVAVLIALVFFGAQLQVPALMAFPSFASFNSAAPTANTCAVSGCHTGTTSATAATISFPTGTTGYTPGGPPIMLTVTVPGASFSTWGFFLAARIASNLSLHGGNFNAGDNGTTGTTGGSGTFTFPWTPPAAGTTGSVNFYLTGDNTSSVSTSNLFSTGMVSLSPVAAAVAPTISTQPASKAVTVGQTAVFSVAAAGTATLTHQWRKKAAGLPGATSATYTTPPTTIADNSSPFSLVVSNTPASP